jgi:hypothetical protein
MGARVTWSAGGEAELVAIEGDRTTFSSSRAWPPGSRPEGALPGGERVWVKVHGSHRTDDGRFRVVGRLLDATRELRASLAASLPGGDPG